MSGLARPFNCDVCQGKGCTGCSYPRANGLVGIYERGPEVVIPRPPGQPTPAGGYVNPATLPGLGDRARPVSTAKLTTVSADFPQGWVNGGRGVVTVAREGDGGAETVVFNVSSLDGLIDALTLVRDTLGGS